MPSPNEIRKQITEKIIEALKNDSIPWHRPWSVSKDAGRPCNVLTRKPYSGINPLLLHLHGLEHGLQSRWYATFDQWKSLGGSVQKRPEHVEPERWGCQIVFFKPVSKTIKDEETGEEREHGFRLMRTYTVFNVDQVDGEALDKYRVSKEEHPTPERPDFRPAGELVEATGADIRYGGDQAFYKRPVPEDAWPHHTDGDYIQVPERCRFMRLGHYYETVLHEMGHWAEVRVGIDHRKAGYAMGELVAEMAASFVSAELGIPDGEDMSNHAAYLKSWLDAMKADSTYIFRASTQASKVADFLLSFAKQPQGEPEPVPAVADAV